MGIRLLARAIEEPLRQIVENAGEDAAVVLNAARTLREVFGFDAPFGYHYVQSDFSMGMSALATFFVRWRILWRHERGNMNRFVDKNLHPLRIVDVIGSTTGGRNAV